MVSLTIDGRTVQARLGTSVLDAALAHGIDVPRLCHHPDLSVSGGCRLCQVEVEGRPAPAPSCGLACEDGMVIRTQSDDLRALRRDVIDVFLSEHPLDCVTCDKSGACQLQRYAYELGIKKTTLELKVGRTLYQDDNPFFLRDHQYCILCGRCVRVCEEIVGVNAIDIVGRGYESHVGTPFDGKMIDSTCVFCGNCVQVCPTASLLPISRLGKGREWELERVRTICGYCGVGCQIEFARKDGHILYAQAPADAPVNGEFLCSKGRYGWDFASSPERLTQPMIRRDLAYRLGLTDEPWELSTTSPLDVRKPKVADSFVPVDWDTALDLVAGRLADTVSAHGPDAVMGLASARCTNEENYLFQKFLRAGVGTNNLDHCARL
jgi:formate dehydrogenase alpha subunit